MSHARLLKKEPAFGLMKKIKEFIEGYESNKLGWIIREGSIILPGSRIGKKLETGHNVIIRERCTIGDNVKIWSNTVIDYGGKIGSNVKIHCNCYIAQHTVIEDNVFIGPGVVTLNDIHPGCKFSRECMLGPTVEEGAQLGGNSTILPRVRIGRKSLVGAGSVVACDIPPFSVAYGVPARVRKSVFDLKCRTGLTDKPYKHGEWK
jgi:acetyltransferase-like isoleucine patch superfamily enzyme